MRTPEKIDELARDMVDSWELIPNPRLDPYNGRFGEDNEEMDADIPFDEEE